MKSEANEDQQLFYIPKQNSRNHKDNKNQRYSENFIELFKTAITKVYKNSPDSSKQSQTQFVNPSILLPIRHKYSTKERIRTEAKQDDSFLNSLSERKKLVKEIMNQKVMFASMLRKKKINGENKINISKRCRTMNAHDLESIKNDSDKHLQTNIRVGQAPSKYRLYNKVSIRPLNCISKTSSQKKDQILLPDIRISPNEPQEKQIVEKYRNFELKYKSNEYLKVPIQITPVTSNRNETIQFNKYINQIQNRDSLENEDGDSPIKYKQFGHNSKQRPFKGVIKTLESQYDSQRNGQFQLENVRNNSRKISEKEVCRPKYKLSKKKAKISFQDLKVQPKNLIDLNPTIKQETREKTSHNTFLNKSRKKIPNQSTKFTKEPIDDYFQPWQDNAIEAKEYPIANHRDTYHSNYQKFSSK